MLVLNVPVGGGLQLGNSAFLQLLAKEKDAVTVAITTRLPQFNIDLGEGNVVKIVPRFCQQVKAVISGTVAPVTITPPGIVPQAFACGIDGQARYVPRTRSDQPAVAVG